jgi:hypothetical protein
LISAAAPVRLTAKRLKKEADNGDQMSPMLQAPAKDILRPPRSSTGFRRRNRRIFF